MTVSDLVNRLSAILSEHGNVDVYIDDADTHWSLRLTSIEFVGGRVELGGDYRDSIMP